ncbi:MAG: hypothetical protein KAJ56_00730 [Candidatus Aenigmarchaeota archaeon]|nr:hypothetical protein [Candidatus Aenigmarchaeota archaeon]
MPKDQKEQFLDNLNLIITLQIFLVVIIGYMIQIGIEAGLDSVTSSTIIKSTYPLAFLLFSLVIIKYNTKIENALFFKKGEILSILNNFIDVYFLNFGVLLFSLYYIFSEIPSKILLFIFEINLVLSLSIPVAIFTILFLSLFKTKKKHKT